MLTPAKSALLARYLLLMVILMLNNFAEFHPVDNHRNKLASVGEFVYLDCIMATVKISQVHWIKNGTQLFSSAGNKTQTNFTSHRMSINPISPTKLEISSVHQDDAGIYTCKVTNQKGVEITEWNLTVSETERPEEIEQVWPFPWIIPLVIGLALSGITCSAVLLYRKLRARTTSQDRVWTRTPSQDQAPVHGESGGGGGGGGGGEVVPAQPHGSTDHRTNHGRRNQYMERINSIYGHQ